MRPCHLRQQQRQVHSSSGRLAVAAAASIQWQPTAAAAAAAAAGTHRPAKLPKPTAPAAPAADTLPLLAFDRHHRLPLSVDLPQMPPCHRAGAAAARPLPPVAGVAVTTLPIISMSGPVPVYFSARESDPHMPSHWICKMALMQHNLVNTTQPGPKAVWLMSPPCVVTVAGDECAGCVLDEACLSMVTVRTPESGLQTRASTHWHAMLGCRIAEMAMYTSLGTSLMFSICQQPERPAERTCQWYAATPSASSDFQRCPGRAGRTPHST